MEIGLLNLVEKLALVPLAPLPVLPYSWNETPEVLGSPVFQIDQPAELITELMTVFWKQTLAYCPHGRPRYTDPLPADEPPDAAMDDLLIT